MISTHGFPRPMPFLPSQAQGQIVGQQPKMPPLEGNDMNLISLAQGRTGLESRSCTQHNIAKVGVEGSNPFARSNFSIPCGLSVLSIKIVATT